MKAELIKVEISTPEIFEDWDYDESAKIGKRLFMRWKDITPEMANHFRIAREMLRGGGGDRRSEKFQTGEIACLKDWGDYCQEVSGIEDKNNARRAFNGLLAIFFPKELKAHVSYSTGENEWYTPAKYIEATKAVMGNIDVDPASSEVANQIIKAKKYYTIEDNGLTKSWKGRVWMNPPYSQPLIVEFSKAFVMKYKSGEIREACILINNATETTWLQMLLKICVQVCFIKGRIKFIDIEGNASGSPLQGQLILYFGNNNKKFINEFNQFGIIK